MTRANSHAAVRLAGTVPEIRHMEDAIRATGKYTEGLLTLRSKHPAIVMRQSNAPSPVFVKCYEVYPDTDINEKLPMGQAVDRAMNWLWADVDCVKVRFWYNYRTGQATVEIKGGEKAARKLKAKIPGFWTELKMESRMRGQPAVPPNTDENNADDILLESPAKVKV